MCDQCIFRDTPARDEICSDCVELTAARRAELLRRQRDRFIAILCIYIGVLCLILAGVAWISIAGG